MNDKLNFIDHHFDDVVGVVEIEYYDCDLEYAIKNNIVAPNGYLVHICMLDDRILSVDTRCYYALDLTEEMFKSFRSTIYHHCDKTGKPATITEIWYETESGELVEALKRETIYSSELAKRWATCYCYDDTPDYSTPAITQDKLTEDQAMVHSD